MLVRDDDGWKKEVQRREWSVLGGEFNRACCLEGKGGIHSDSRFLAEVGEWRLVPLTQRRPGLGHGK